MNRAQQVAVLFCALLLAQTDTAEAAFVQRSADQIISPTQNIQGAGYLDSFASIDNAFRLVSISDGGSITGGEGGGQFTLLVRYTNNTEVSLTSFNMNPLATVEMDTAAFTNLGFTEGTINGLRFISTDSNSISPRIQMNNVIYTFETRDEVSNVPEPVSAALLGTGLLGLAWFRRHRQSGTSQRNS